MSPRPRCPFCSSTRVSSVSGFGSQLLTSQWRCDACESYFEAVREEFSDTGPAAPSPWSSSEAK